MENEDVNIPNTIAEIPKIIGGWVNVPDHLKCKLDLTKIRLKPSGLVQAQVWNKYTWIDLYDINETVPKNKLSEKQLLALSVGRERLKIARTCDQCKQIVNISDIKNVEVGKFCKDCLKELGYALQVHEEET